MGQLENFFESLSDDYDLCIVDSSSGDGGDEMLNKYAKRF